MIGVVSAANGLLSTAVIVLFIAVFLVCSSIGGER